MSTIVDALILAGGVSCDSLKSCSSADYEALIEIAGRPMIEFVIDALRTSEQVGRIVVIGPRQALEGKISNEASIVQHGHTIVENVVIGLNFLNTKDKVLIATCDIPLITGEAVDSFLELCSQREGDLYYPIVDKKVNEAKYPTVKRTYVNLKEGTFTGGNMALVNPAIVPRCLEWAEKVTSLRKRPWALSCLLGWRIVGKFALGILSIKDIEQHVSELLKIKGVCVISPYPEVGIDVDKPSDLALARMICNGAHC